MWVQKIAYLRDIGWYDGPTDRSSVFRCDFERREWKELPVVYVKGAQLSPIVNAKTGQEDGLLMVKSKCTPRGKEIFRVLFK